MDDLNPCPLCGALPCDWVDDPHKAEVGLCWTLAKIREVLGVGEKPMLGELPDIIAATLTAQAAEIARLKAIVTKAFHAADVVLAPICAEVGKDVLHPVDCPDLVAVMAENGVQISAQHFADLYDATHPDLIRNLTGSQSHDKSEGYAREVAEAIKRGGPICD